MPGFVPQVTCGRSSETSISSSRSNTASSSVGSVAPALDRCVPVRPFRRARPALEIRERDVVGRDQSCARARLDRHVADREPPFHREALDHRAGVLDHVADAAVDAEPADRGEHDVLRADAVGQLADEADAKRARLALRQRLRREHVLDLRRADAERERAERAVRRRVRVAADDRHARAASARARGRSRARSPRDRCRSHRAGRRTRRSCARARRAAAPRADPSACRRRSRRCDPSSRASGRAAARVGRRDAATRTPAAT